MGGEQSVQRRFHGEVFMLEIDQGNITPVVHLKNEVTVTNVSDETFDEIVEVEVNELMKKLQIAFTALQSLPQLQSGERRSLPQLQSGERRITQN